MAEQLDPMTDAGGRHRGRSGHRGRNIAVAVVALLVVVALAGGAYLLGRSTAASASSLTLEPAQDRGADPFTDSVQVGKVVELPADVRAAAASTRKALATDAGSGAAVAPGTATGLYGGSGSTQVCDASKLVTYLKAHRSKATAWARVLGVRVADIPSYVSGLTPVVLTSDTLVTNHGYEDGHPTALRSVLQAGTAVMVDSRGVPRVKCNCGNPLTPAAPTVLSDAKVVGRSWPGWTVRTLVVVHAGQPVTTLQVIDTTTGEPAALPVGDAGTTPTSGGGKWVAARSNASGGSTIITSTDGSTWTDAGTVDGIDVTALAYGDGAWLAAGPPSSWQDMSELRDTKVVRSADLVHWSDPSPIGPDTSIAYADGRWVAVGSVTGQGTYPLLSTSTDGTNWNKVDLPGNRTEGGIEALTGVTHQDDTWIAVGYSEPIEADPDGTVKIEREAFTSTDGTTWQAEHGAWQVTCGDAQSEATSDIGETLIAASPDRWIQLFPSGGGDPTCAQKGSTGHGRTVDGDLGSTPFDGSWGVSLASGDDTWLALASSRAPGEDSDGEETYVYASTDADAWNRLATLPGKVGALAYGGSSGAGSAPTGASTTTATTTTTASPAACDQDAIKRAAASPNIVIGHIECDGDWALTGRSDAQTHDELSGGVLHRVDGTWQPVPRDTPLCSGSLGAPERFRYAACEVS